MHSSPTRERVAHHQSASNKPPPPEPGRPATASHPSKKPPKKPPRLVADLCDFTDVETIYDSHYRTLHVHTAVFKRDQTLLAHANPTSIANILPIAEAIFAELDDDQEHFIILTCDAYSQIYGYKVIATGSFGHVKVPHDVVVRAALLLGARRLILLHNHPSGNLRPSEQDAILTNRLYFLTALHDIDIIDHIIYSPISGALSMRPMFPELWPQQQDSETEIPDE